MKPIKKNLYDKILRLMPIVCVDLLIKRGKKILLVKRKNNPAKGEWWLPGGRIFKTETIERAARRKARGEVGLSCSFKKISQVTSTYFKKTEDMQFDIHTINIIVELKQIDNREPAVDWDHGGWRWADCNSKSYHLYIQKILAGQGFKYRRFK
ncbi:MAG: hypothetical protein A3J93_01155 [Candidatus Magasanikbacteria bacterium RIFOXYC2_FULL_42_28]|uniref:Nudix hydrolase domain-containing protein n=1 Tax=Candidatus Magasanikbacteria bacterium RIFOXYC2_FULL_42_28 TaxID=1798704 RepID=A0A1F6NYN2_9BACT|nr:MAG: hypothetical protein A3J93_01155 [Candidatus Magasanikbacteria bacterium RIFOXYC2_FULL_42_28]